MLGRIALHIGKHQAAGGDTCPNARDIG